MAGLQKILLVEDNNQLVEIYHTILKLADYQVEIALDAKEALDKAKSFEPDLIFLDIMIPGKSGIEVLKILRSEPEYKCQKTKIVMLTNLSQDNQMDPAVDELSDGYVVKANIDAVDLVDVIQSFTEV